MLGRISTELKVSWGYNVYRLRSHERKSRVRRRGSSMHRREFLKLGAVASGTFLVGGTGRFGSFLDAPKEIPTTDRLVATNLVDNIYDVYAKGGKIGNLTITRNTLPHPYGSEVSLLSEHGLAFHLDSF